jgi:hypothetical protein
MPWILRIYPSGLDDGLALADRRERPMTDVFSAPIGAFDLILLLVRLSHLRSEIGIVVRVNSFYH